LLIFTYDKQEFINNYKYFSIICITLLNSDSIIFKSYRVIKAYR
jgi:hypothetical protein